MYAYLLETYLLSILAALLYGCFVRPFAAPRYRKYALLLLIALSMSLPLIIDNWATQEGEPTCLHQHPVTEIVCVDYCPHPEELPVCYEIALLQERFCDCTAVSKENLLVFRQNHWYDLCLWASAWCGAFLLPLAIVAIGLCLLRIAYLVYLVCRSRRQTLSLQGKTYTLLHPPRPLAVGSFKLWHNYIIWQRELDDLPPAEREVVLWHEIAHLEQRDTWLKILLGCLQPIWAVNPAYYFFQRELGHLCEEIADQFTLRRINHNVSLYVSVLLKLKSPTFAFAAQHFGAGALKKRVLSMTQRPQHYNKISSLGVIVLAVLLYYAAQAIQPRLAQEVDKMRVYQTLAQDNQSSGRSLFCKHCLLEKLNK